VTDAEAFDVVVVGAGAAGLAAAIFTARAAPALRVACLDGATRIGAKILISGGSRCNVTNRTVTEHDFWGGPSRVVRHVLRAFPADRAASFFGQLGVSLHEEEDGKLFPDSDSARTVLSALLQEAARLRVDVRPATRVASVKRHGTFSVHAGERAFAASTLVLATGGRSLPKTGSDGAGYALAESLGHTIVQTTPGLAPLVLLGSRHALLAGRTHPATVTLRVAGRSIASLSGPMLWTHFGISGPVALNLSRHWHRARLMAAPDDVAVSLNVCPGETEHSLEAWLQSQAAARPRAQVNTLVATRLPAAVADAWVSAAGIGDDATLAHLTRAARRALVRGLLDTPLQIRDSRGYNYAEVTAGGVPLDEIDHRTMASRRCDGLYMVGEMLDVDGRLGGFNFQWAWSSAWVAGQAIAQRGSASP
jgi:predicted Rossmann fold flavoprotein